MELYKLTIHEVVDLLRKGEVTAEELTKKCIDRINSVDNQVNAFLTVSEEEALKQARDVDKQLSSGKDVGPIAGIPMGIKDNICTNGIKTTCASKILEKFIPPYDATVTDKLKDNKAVIMGKLNMDEFAMGSSTENSAFKKTTNPWDITRVPGGSSGGSAASVAANEVFYALGSDTGGSIRQPAAYCGIVGLKPTYGSVSRYGLVAFASSLDQIGPLTKDVQDCAMVLNAISGHDELDSTSADIEHPDYTTFLEDNVKGLKIGVPKEYFGEGLNEEVREKVENAIEVYKKLGAEIVDISLPSTDYALSAYYIIASAEASSNLSRYDGIKYGYRTDDFEDLIDLYKKSRSEGFGSEVKRRIMLGSYALSSGYYDAYYLKALKVRTLIKNDFDKAFEDVDIILSPTVPGTAFKLGEKIDDPLQMYLTDVYTVPVNIAGIPAISIPCGFDSNGMPVGLQLIAKPFNEGSLIKTAYTFEQNTDYHIKRPVLNWR